MQIKFSSLLLLKVDEQSQKRIVFRWTDLKRFPHLSSIKKRSVTGWRADLLVFFRRKLISEIFMRLGMGMAMGLGVNGRTVDGGAIIPAPFGPSLLLNTSLAPPPTTTTATPFSTETPTQQQQHQQKELLHSGGKPLTAAEMLASQLMTPISAVTARARLQASPAPLGASLLSLRSEAHSPKTSLLTENEMELVGEHEDLCKASVKHSVSAMELCHN